MFFSTANAADTTQASNPIIGMLPIVVIFVIFYFLIIRPQSKKIKTEQKMRESLQIGNKVVTLSGIFGIISEIDNEKGVVSLNISKGVDIVILKASISEVLKEKE
jgi:preprotein translocase subunit YajC